MKKKNITLLKNIGLFTIGSFGSKILSFLLVPLYTAILTTENYGAVDLITSTASLLTPILLLSIFDATLRFGMDPNFKNEDVISTSIHIAIRSSVILIIVVLFIAFTNIVNIPNTYLIFLCAYFILGSANQIFTLYLKAKNQAMIIAVSGILCTLITCLSNIMLLILLRWGIIGYMISNTIGLFFQNLYQLFAGKIYKDIRFRQYNDLSEPMIKYSLPLVANSVSWWINNASDRYILSFIKGVSENGIYAVSYKVPTILSMFQGIFFNAWSISAIEEFDENDSDGFIGSNYSLYSSISVVVCSILLIFNIPLATFLYKKNYFIAWKCVPFLLVATVFSGISQFEGSLFAAAKKTKTVAQTTVIGAIINIICNFIFIYYIGSIGAAFATLIGYLTTWIFRTYALKKIVRIRVNWKLHICSIIILIVQSFFATIGKNMKIQLLLFIMLIVINRKFIIPFKNILNYHI